MSSDSCVCCFCLSAFEFERSLRESAFVHRLIAHVESERLLFFVGLTIVRIASSCMICAALAEPIVREAIDENVFGRSGGLVFAAKAIEQVIECFLAF